jgi:two-component system cell cycle response regulator
MNFPGLTESLKKTLNNKEHGRYLKERWWPSFTLRYSVKQTGKKSMKVLVIEPASATPSRLWTLFAEPRHYNNPDSLYRIDHVVSATRGEQALEVFHKLHPDLVVIDYEHGGEDALLFCQQIRTGEKDRHTGFIFFSHEVQHDDGVFERVLRHGGDDFIDGKASDRECVARVNSVFRFKAMADRLRSVNHRLKMLSLTDELTGLSNMRAFNIDYQKLIKGCRKGDYGLGVIMLDLDHFKKINDSANHLVGSFVIGEVGRLIAHSGVLGKDAVALRWG